LLTFHPSIIIIIIQKNIKPFSKRRRLPKGHWVKHLAPRKFCGLGEKKEEEKKNEHGQSIKFGKFNVFEKEEKLVCATKIPTNIQPKRSEIPTPAF